MDGHAPSESTGTPIVNPGLARRVSAFHSPFINYVAGMDSTLLEDLLASNKPFQVETAAGRVFDIPHRDFVSFSRKRTALYISYEENNEDHFAIVPLLTVTSVMAKDV